MGDTYNSAAEAEADRAQQQTLLEALGAWDRALRRDECGAWRIDGTRGRPTVMLLQHKICYSKRHHRVHLR
jgi:hypothetical protein